MSEKTHGEMMDEERERGKAFWQQMNARWSPYDQFTNWPWLPPFLPPPEEADKRYYAQMSDHRRYIRNGVVCHRCSMRTTYVCCKPNCLFYWCQYCWAPLTAYRNGHKDPANLIID